MAGKPQDKSPAVFNCPSCGASIEIRALGQSVVVVCRSCNSTVSVANENYKIIEAATKKVTVKPVIALGQRGNLRGTLWEVIGFLYRSDGSGEYFWQEYLLFNPQKGFRWLTEFDGHWNYVVVSHEKPTMDSVNKIAHFLGKEYSLFHKGKAKVVQVLGEFYWRVQKGDTVAVEDYICPPEILSLEKDDEEVIWSMGEYIEPETIAQAFQITESMPVKVGVAPNEPSIYLEKFRPLAKAWGFFLMVLIFLQLGIMVISANKPVYVGNYNYSNLDLEKTKVTPSFTLEGGIGNVELMLISPVQNNWLALEADLVDDQTGKSHELELGVEYYSGYDNGYWSEGSQMGRKILPSIPDGNYHLNFQTEAGSNEQTFQITVKRDVVTWSNFFLSIVLISLLPIFFWWRRYSFERMRWSTSDFSPYWSGEDEEEE